MSITAMKQALEALEKLWDIIDDIDTYSDMSKGDDSLYRSLVEHRQRQRFDKTGISSDGHELNGGAITALRTAIAEAEKQEQCKEHGECFGGKCIYTTPPAAPVQEPVAWLTKELMADYLDMVAEAIEDNSSEALRHKAHWMRVRGEE